jgi:GH25 family lysozyme M1 (1,4-beta-N-acetylmuramidase)
MSIVKSRTGVEPILYTSPSFANDYLDNTVKNKYNLWIAHWRTDLNPNTDGWYNWDFGNTV